MRHGGLALRERVTTLASLGGLVDHNVPNEHGGRLVVDLLRFDNAEDSEEVILRICGGRKKSLVRLEIAGHWDEDVLPLGNIHNLTIAVFTNNALGSMRATHANHHRVEALDASVRIATLVHEWKDLDAIEIAYCG